MIIKVVNVPHILLRSLHWSTFCRNVSNKWCICQFYPVSISLCWVLDANLTCWGKLVTQLWNIIVLLIPRNKTRIRPICALLRYKSNFSGNFSIELHLSNWTFRMSQQAFVSMKQDLDANLQNSAKYFSVVCSIWAIEK